MINYDTFFCLGTVCFIFHFNDGVDGCYENALMSDNTFTNIDLLDWRISAAVSAFSPPNVVSLMISTSRVMLRST